MTVCSKEIVVTQDYVSNKIVIRNGPDSRNNSGTSIALPLMKGNDNIFKMR